MDVNEGNSGPGSSLSSFPQYQPPRKQSKIRALLHVIKKYWYVVLGVVVIVAVLVFLQVRQANAEAAWGRAQDSFAKADYDAAAKAMQGLGVPSDPDRLRVYSQTMLATRQLDQALVGYERMYADKKDPAVKIIIGNIHNEKKQHDKAIDVYREIMDTDKTYVQAYVNLATLHRMQGDKDKAIEVAKKGIEANPSNIVLNELYVSMLLDEKGSDEYKKAVEKLRNLDPNDPLLESLENS